jgi:CBS domain containing-hemolysin-like protein
MINDVCKVLQIPVDTFDKIRGDSDSLAGLVLEIAGEFPQVNETITTEGFSFVPLVINKNRIEKVKIILQKNENAQIE